MSDGATRDRVRPDACGTFVQTGCEKPIHGPCECCEEHCQCERVCNACNVSSPNWAYNRCPNCGEMDRVPAPDAHSLRAVGGLLKRIAELERWEIGFRNIVTILLGARTEFEIPDVVESVRAQKQRLAELESLCRECRELLDGTIELDDDQNDLMLRLDAALEPSPRARFLTTNSRAGCSPSTPI